MPWAGAGTDAVFQGFLQLLGQCLAVTWHNQKHHFHVAIGLAADHQAVFYLSDGFYLAVDFGRANTDTAGVQRGVGAAVDDGTAVFGEFDEVPMGPDAGRCVGKGLKVGRAIALAVRVIPEAHGHGGQWLPADQFAPALFDGLTIVAVSDGVYAQKTALNFAPANR